MSTQSYERDFNKNFMISFGVHMGLLLLAFAGGEVISRVFRNNDVEVIRSSVRVDVVGMPKFTVQELKKMQAQPIPETKPEVVAKGVKEETKTETEDVIKKDDLVIQEQGKKKANFLNMLNDYSSKKVSAKVEQKGTKAGAGNQHLDSLIIEGNRLSQGSALVGDYTDEQNSAFSAYVQSLPGIIRQNWKLPQWLLDRKDLKCRIRIFLSSEGKLLKLEIAEPSTVAEFDAKAEFAIRESKEKFPKPSEEVAARLNGTGIVLGFPL